MTKESYQNIWIIGIFILVNLFVSNPNLADHKEAVFEKFQVGIDYIEKSVLRKNYLLFSITSFDTSMVGYNTSIGIGIASKVFIFTNEQKDKTIKDYLKSRGSDFVSIGNQVWMNKNLNVNRFRNGDLIPEVKDDSSWIKAGKSKQPAWCYYNNDSVLGFKYGKLYNWYAVIDPRGLAPTGWRIPNDKDWNQLIINIGGNENSADKLKTSFGWIANGSGSNSTIFSGLPVGTRNMFYPQFDGLGVSTVWWSMCPNPDSTSITSLSYRRNSLSNEIYFGGQENGYSVRCIQN